MFVPFDMFYCKELFVIDFLLTVIRPIDHEVVNVHEVAGRFIYLVVVTQNRLKIFGLIYLCSYIFQKLGTILIAIIVQAGQQDL